MQNNPVNNLRKEQLWWAMMWVNRQSSAAGRKWDWGEGLGRPFYCSLAWNYSRVGGNNIFCTLWRIYVYLIICFQSYSYSIIYNIWRMWFKKDVYYWEHGQLNVWNDWGSQIPGKVALNGHSVWERWQYYETVSIPCPQFSRSVHPSSESSSWKIGGKEAEDRGRLFLML